MRELFGLSKQWSSCINQDGQCISTILHGNNMPTLAGEMEPEFVEKVFYHGAIAVVHVQESAHSV